MGAALLVCRLLLAGVFALAGATKLADLDGSRRAVAEFGVPERLAGTVGVLLPVLELTVAALLVPLFSARFAALAAGVLLVAFCAGIANALAHGREPDCHCFGQVHSAPAGLKTLARNAVLLALAGFVAVGGWKRAGVSATHWVTRVQAAWLVAIGAGLVVLCLVGFVVWFCLQLLAQNGRTLGRLEALEETLNQTLSGLGMVEDEPLGNGLQGGGLAVGSTAPAFELEDLHGERHSLASLLSAGRPLIVVFSDAGCGPCHALMPELARWQDEYADALTLAVIASGDVEQNRAKANEHGLEPVLLQKEREVSDAYESYGTPTAVVVDPDGRVASPAVGGEPAIRTLVSQATRSRLAVVQVPAPARANGNGGPPSQSDKVGQPAPRLVLLDLDGAHVALEDLYAERTLAIFWNPGCGFCERMLEDLKLFERQPPAGAPRLVVISSGDPERVREQQLGSTVLLDADGEAMGAFDARGTPMGVLVDEGLIASHVAAGADAVFELARAPR